MKHKNALFWIGGDFNLPDINWENESVVGNQYPLELNICYLDTMHELGWHRTVNAKNQRLQYTRYFCNQRL